MCIFTSQQSQIVKKMKESSSTTRTVLIKGNKFKRKFWNVIYQFYKKRADKYFEKVVDASDKTFKVNMINFYNPYVIIIKYRLEQANQDYQIVMQGNFKEQFLYWTNHKELPPLFELQDIIRVKHPQAQKIER